MAHTRLTTRHRRSLFGGLALAIAFVFAAAPARAQHHQARMSADLVDHLAAQSQQIDVIVHGDRAEVDALAARYNVVVKRYLKGGAVLEVNAGQLAALAQDDSVDHLSGDTVIRSTADVTAETIGADQVWAGEGGLRPLSGAGVTVAIVDSGIDTAHDALRGRVIFTKDFTGGDGMDRFGHGTHVAGIIAGAAGLTADTSEYRGIAWGAKLVNLRALGDDGSGTVSTVVDAIDWAVDHREELGIRVINLSLGTPVLQPYRDDPLCEAVERAATAGIVVVTAAGNLGRTADGKTVMGSITSPGNSPYALTVGALDTHGTPQRSDDTVATYSSRGPTRYDLIIKPDLVAPGSHIVSAEATDSYLAKTYPERHMAGTGANAYMQLSGTSMASGVVSGAVALLLEARPGLKPAVSRDVLQLTGSSVHGAGLLDAGTGSLNVLGALELLDRHRHGKLPATEIAGETIIPAGMAASYASGLERIVMANGLDESALVGAKSIVWTSSIVWTGSIVWSGSIVWTGPAADSIVWTGSTGDSIVWTGSIVWTSAAANSIVWTGSTGDSIVWTGSAGDSIVWSGSLDSIVWTGSLEGELD